MDCLYWSILSVHSVGFRSVWLGATKIDWNARFDWVFYLCAIIKYWNDLCTIEIWKSSPIPSLKFLLLCIPLPSACRSILTEVATNQSKNYLFYLCAIIKVQNDLCTIEKTKLLVWGPKWIQIKKWSTTKFHNFLRSTIFI